MAIFCTSQVALSYALHSMGLVSHQDMAFGRVVLGNAHGMCTCGGNKTELMMLTSCFSVLLDDWAEGAAGGGAGAEAFAGAGCFGISGLLCFKASGTLFFAVPLEVAFAAPLVKGSVPRGGLISSTANETKISHCAETCLEGISHTM